MKSLVLRLKWQKQAADSQDDSRLGTDGNHEPVWSVENGRRTTPPFSCASPGSVRAVLHTDRLVIRDWREDDAEAALAVYGDPAVARWLTPAIETVTDLGDMQKLLQRWISESRRARPGSGTGPSRWPTPGRSSAG